MSCADSQPGEGESVPPLELGGESFYASVDERLRDGLGCERRALRKGREHGGLQGWRAQERTMVVLLG